VYVQPTWAAVDILLVIVAGVEACIAIFAAALACRSICFGRLNTAPVCTVLLVTLLMQRLSLLVFVNILSISAQLISAVMQHSLYASQQIVSRFSSPEIGRVAAGSASGVKIPWIAWLRLLSFSSMWLLQASCER